MKGGSKNCISCNNSYDKTSLFNIDLAKLGQCKACMFKASLFTIACLGLYLWQLFTSGYKSVYTIAALFALIAFGGLSILHLIAFIWRKLKTS